MTPNLQHLETFWTVTRAGSFTQAASRLRVTQPAVSYRIAALESELGADLFERPRRPLIVTAEGQRLLDFCERFFSEFEATARAMETGRWDSREPVRISCAGAFGRFVVFPVLRRPEFRHVRVQLLFRQPDQILELVDNGASELGIVYEPRVTHTLELEELCVEEFVLVSPPAWESPRSWDLSRLESSEFVTYEECDYVFGRWFDRVMDGQPKRMRSASHFERLEEVLATVADGRGLSIVPEHATRTWVRDGQVRLHRPRKRRALNTEYSVTRPGRAMRPEVEEILRRIRNAGGRFQP